VRCPRCDQVLALSADPNDGKASTATLRATKPAEDEGEGKAGAGLSIGVTHPDPGQNRQTPLPFTLNNVAHVHFRVHGLHVNVSRTWK